MIESKFGNVASDPRSVTDVMGKQQGVVKAQLTARACIYRQPYSGEFRFSCNPIGRGRNGLFPRTSL